MSQLQEVVRCYGCQTFQVQIQKKAKNKRWICKVCNEKQSLKKVYFTGLGNECRNIVREFNMKRGEIADFKNSVLEECFENEPDILTEEPAEPEYEPADPPPRQSKWTTFLSPEEIVETEKAFLKKSSNSNFEDFEEKSSNSNFEDFQDFEKDNGRCENGDLENQSLNYENEIDNYENIDSSNDWENSPQNHPRPSDSFKASKWNRFGGDLTNSQNTNKVEKLVSKRGANPFQSKIKKTKWASFLPPEGAEISSESQTESEMLIGSLADSEIRAGSLADSEIRAGSLADSEIRAGSLAESEIPTGSGSVWRPRSLGLGNSRTFGCTSSLNSWSKEKNKCGTDTTTAVAKKDKCGTDNTTRIAPTTNSSKPSFESDFTRKFLKPRQ